MKKIKKDNFNKNRNKGTLNIYRCLLSLEISNFKQYILVLMTYGWCGVIGAQQLVIVDEVYDEMSSASYRMIGTLQSTSSSVLAASDAAKVIKLLVDEGDFVEAKQVLVKLDVRRLLVQIQQQEYKIAEMKAIIEQRKFHMVNLQADYHALKAPMNQKNVSKQHMRTVKSSLDIATSVWLAAKHQYQAGQSELELLKIKQKDSIIRAPFAGVVIENNADVGEWVNVGEPVVTIFSRDEMEAWLEVPERLAHILVNDLSKKLTLEINDQLLITKNFKLVHNIDKKSGTFYLVAKLNNAHLNLMQGMALTGWVPLGKEKKHTFVHKNAIIKNHNGTFIYKIVESKDKEGNLLKMAEAVPIQILFMNGFYAAIETQGRVNLGDQVVVEGNQRLILSQPVMVKNLLALQ